MIISCQSDGAVEGVKATMTDGTPVTVNAKSVIRATGGYAKNEEMLAKNEDFLPNNLYGSVPNTCMGDGRGREELRRFGPAAGLRQL